MDPGISSWAFYLPSCQLCPVFGNKETNNGNKAKGFSRSLDSNHRRKKDGFISPTLSLYT